MPGARDGAFDEIGLLGYKAASLAAQNLPSAVTAAGASLLGLAFAQGMRSRRSMVERHLRRVDPSLRGPALRQAVQSAFDSYARYWVESFRLPGLSAAEVDAVFSYTGFEGVEAGLAAGTGVILALPHLGGWEWAGRWVADQGHPITVVVEPIEPPELFEWFMSFRRSLGMTVVPLGPEAGPGVIKALRNNEVLCLLCDRDLQGGGVEVEFFGERTTLPAGPATLALRTGAPLLPTAVYFQGRRDRHHGIVRPPLMVERTGKLRQDVQALTQALAHELEVLIRRAPTQWHLFQPNWPSDPGYGEDQHRRDGSGAG
ncbi:MAG TPA: phosphatidylinositol mannoside acyltransferase [Acidimicrobiales bacterium]